MILVLNQILKIHVQVGYIIYRNIVATSSRFSQKNKNIIPHRNEFLSIITIFFDYVASPFSGNIQTKIYIYKQEDFLVLGGIFLMQKGYKSFVNKPPYSFFFFILKKMDIRAIVAIGKKVINNFLLKYKIVKILTN